MLDFSLILAGTAGIVEHLTGIPSEAAYEVTAAPVCVPLTSTSSASFNSRFNFTYFLVIPLVALFPVPER